jgi:hypothetical protein
MECIKDKYVYKGRDISFLVIRKIEQVVSIIAEKTGKAFEEAYYEFLNSDIYSSLQNTNTLMWFENAEFIAGEYFNIREKYANVS